MQQVVGKSTAIAEIVACLSKKDLPLLQKNAAGALANIAADDGMKFIMQFVTLKFQIKTE